MLDFFHYLINYIHWLSVGITLVIGGGLLILLAKSGELIFILNIQEHVYKKQKTKSGIKAAKKVSDLKKRTRNRLPIYGLILIILGVFFILISSL